MRCERLTLAENLTETSLVYRAESEKKKKIIKEKELKTKAESAQKKLCISILDTC